MRLQKDIKGQVHAHSFTCYDPHINWKHYLYLLWSIIDYKVRGHHSLTVHLPFELQHPTSLKNRSRGHAFIFFGEWLKLLFSVRLYWENAPRLRYGTWDLVRGNTMWDFVPEYIDLCLDTGHLLLGSKDAREFESVVGYILYEYGDQIKHVHLSENDFVHDKHWHTKKILTPSLVKKITKGRTYIWEE